MSGERMLDGSKKPDAKAIVEHISAKSFKYWQKITEFIEDNYPGVFPKDDWLFSRNLGWSLRFKKSKSFCTLIPEKNRLLILIVFGAKEREGTEKILPELNLEIRNKYENATTYHDGKWLLISLDNDKIFDDVKRLLIIKRNPKKRRCNKPVS